MIITKDTSPYIVSCDDSIQFSLQKINKNRRRLVFVVSENGEVTGALTDGDFRRWVVGASNIDLLRPVSEISNKNVITAKFHDSKAKLQTYLSPKISAIPLKDELNRLIAIAWCEDGLLRLGSRTIGHNNPALLIAEIGNNHNGSLDLAKRLIEAAAKAGADCAKFQLRDMASLYSDSKQMGSEDLGAEYTLDLLSRFQLTVDQMFEALNYVRQCGMIPLCTPWDLLSLNRLNEYGVVGFKISSADLTNHELLHAASVTGKPLILSTGMSSEQEIRESVSLLQDNGASFSLLQCNSTYPAPYRDINLAYMDRLVEIAQVPVGYSGHERGFEVCIAAVARGAKIIEKHFSLDRNMEGNDHRVSLLPNEFSEMVKSIRNVEEAIGSGSERTISQGERLNREVLAKSLVASRPIIKGEKLFVDMISSRSPGRGLQPSRLHDLLGVTASRDMAQGDVFFESDILGKSARPRDYIFDRPWGIPVRYYDFQELTRDVRMDFVEIHFSYRDLDLNPADYIKEPTELNLVVHSPELFAGDHVMDLASADKAYQERSMTELQRVINRTRELKEYFPKAECPLIIINAGGFTSNHFLPESERQILYDRIGEALTVIDAAGVEIVPQTMPPFPWHFGGQRFHNLFMDHEEITKFCKAHDTRICYDISHSKLACNYFGWSMQQFTQSVGPYVAHLHIVDAKAYHDEGLQIGDGEIDFKSLANDLKDWAPGVSFIPEIWQGHKNSGEGFWVALDRLERSFGF